MKEKSKIMQLLSKHESLMLVPMKYNIHKEAGKRAVSKSNKPVKCLANHKLEKARSGMFSSFDTADDQKTRETRNSMDGIDTSGKSIVNPLSGCQDCNQRASSKFKVCKHQKKYIKNLKSKKKNKGFLYTSCNIKI